MISLKQLCCKTLYNASPDVFIEKMTSHYIGYLSNPDNREAGESWLLAFLKRKTGTCRPISERNPPHVLVQSNLLQKLYDTRKDAFIKGMMPYYIDQLGNYNSRDNAEATLLVFLKDKPELAAGMKKKLGASLQSTPQLDLRLSALSCSRLPSRSSNSLCRPQHRKRRKRA